VEARSWLTLLGAGSPVYFLLEKIVIETDGLNLISIKKVFFSELLEIVRIQKRVPLCYPFKNLS